MCEPDDGTTAKSDHFNDLLKRWDRFREASQYENQRMHDRFNWLMISQPVLFTALVFAVKERKDCPSEGSAQTACTKLNAALNNVEWLTIGLGLTISSLLFVGLLAAGRKHWQWTNGLNALASKLNTGKESDQAVTFGSEPHWPARTTSLIAPTVASAFVGAWAYLTWVLAGEPVRWFVFGADATMFLFVLLVSELIPVRRWLHRFRAWKKSR